MDAVVQFDHGFWTHTPYSGDSLLEFITTTQSVFREVTLAYNGRLPVSYSLTVFKNRSPLISRACLTVTWRSRWSSRGRTGRVRIDVGLVRNCDS